ncbi:MAG: ADP-ribosylation factor-like protein [Candidatus Hodarchaeota archaeon]
MDNEQASDARYDSMGEGMIPITITGLTSAGKTTMIERLLTGEFRAALPATFGMNIERYEVKRKSKLEFQIFDLGGHEAFREVIWANYVRLALGSIFVFDANDRSHENLLEAKNWFWKVIEWTSAPVIMFVANKIDLEHMSLWEIAEGLDLMRFTHNPKVSFQVFFASMKTGENFKGMFDWFFEKIEENVKKMNLGNILGLYIHKIDEIWAEFLIEDINHTEFRSIVQNLGTQAIESQSNLQLYQTKNRSIVCVQSPESERFCSIILDEEGSQGTVKARMIGSILLQELEKIEKPNIPKATINILSQLYAPEFKPLFKTYL